VQKYDIRYDDKYGQLAQIDIAAEGAGYEPWLNQTLTSVNDCVVRLAVIEGELVDWHSHEHEDEFFFVLEGRLELEVEGRDPFLLGVNQGVTGRDDPAWRRSPPTRARTHGLADGRAGDGDPDRERLTESAPRCRQSTVEKARPKPPSELFCESNQLPHQGCVSSPFAFVGP
jgi:hypothetical protein